MKKFIYLYYTDEEKYSELTDEELGQLIRAGIRYGATGELPDFSDNRFLKFAWTDFKISIDISSEAYEKQIKSGSKGGVTKNFKDKLNLSDVQLKSIQTICKNRDTEFSDFAKKSLQELRDTGEVFEGTEGFNFIMDKLKGDKDER